MRKIISVLVLVIIIQFISYAQDFNVNFQAHGESQVVNSVMVYNINTEASVQISGGDTLHLFNSAENKLLQNPDINMLVFPNPSGEHCSLEFEIQNQGEAFLEIYDISGKLIFNDSRVFEKAIHRFNISGISAGVYNITIRGENFKYASKLISTSNTSSGIQVDYLGMSQVQHELIVTKDLQAQQEMAYTYGDVLLIKGISNMGHKSATTLVLSVSDAPQVIVDFEFVSCIDLEGYIYETIRFDNQMWMSENLRTTKYDVVNLIAKITDSEDWANTWLAAYCDYDNLESNSTDMGRLYNWYAVANQNNLCPDGWHVPNESEWLSLEIYLGMDISDASDIGWRGDEQGCFLKDINFWQSQTGEGINSSGFSALPAGIRSFTGVYYYLNKNTAWWSMGENNELNAWSRALQTDRCEIYREDGSKKMGLSVRCIRDSVVITSLPEVETLEASEILPYSARIGGEVTADGGNTVSERGMVYSDSPNPTLTDNLEFIENGDGIGEFSSVVSNLTPNTTYYVRAYATNEGGTEYGDEISFQTLALLYTPGDGVTDINDNFYNTIIINGREYMASNLRASSTNDGYLLNKISDPGEWSMAYGGSYCWYNNDSITYNAYYGKLYNYYTFEYSNMCPTDWHIITDDEFTDLELFIGLPDDDAEVIGWRGDNVGGTLKESGIDNWQTPNTGATNTSGYGALPGGYRHEDGTFYGLGEEYNVWAPTSDYMMVGMRKLSYDQHMTYRELNDSYSDNSKRGYAIRCVKDLESTATLPVVETEEASSILPHSFSIGGEVVADGDASVLSRGIVYSDSPTPTLTDNLEIIENGDGIGVFSNIINELSHNTTYYVRAYATNSVGTAYGNEVSVSTLELLYSIGDGVTDINDNFYNTIIINGIEYMASNLRASSNNDGYLLNKISDPSEWSITYDAAYCWYNNDSISYNAVYGKLYNLYAFQESHMCPTGWHIITDDEFTDLELFIGLSEDDAEVIGWRGDNVGGTLKESGVENWQTPNTGATNTSGYGALPGGYRHEDGTFYGLDEEYNVWAPTSDYMMVGMRKLSYDQHMTYRELNDSYSDNSKRGYAIRCVKTIVAIPSVSTQAIDNVSDVEATSGASVINDGGGSLSATGIVWGEDENPSISVNSGIIDKGSGVYSFVDVMTGLSPTTTYYVRAYATNEAGTGYGDELSFTTLTPFACGDDIVFTYRGVETTYGTVDYAGRCWLDRNLGATGPAIAIDDSNSFGDLFQWGREDDDHQDRTSLMSDVLAPDGQQPGHNMFIHDDQSFLGDWNSNFNWADRWYNSISGEVLPADPCPDGWGVPIISEWQDAVAHGSWETSDDAYNSPLKIPLSGLREPAEGVYGEGYDAFFWSATSFEPGSAYIISLNMEYIDTEGFKNYEKGYSVRCIKESIPY